MTFFEVFDTLSISGSLYDLFAEVIVEKVNISRSTFEVKIHLFSKRLISRKQIKQMEYQIKKQLFHKMSNKIYI